MYIHDKRDPRRFDDLLHGQFVRHARVEIGICPRLPVRVHHMGAGFLGNKPRDGGCVLVFVFRRTLPRVYGSMRSRKKERNAAGPVTVRNLTTLWWQRIRNFRFQFNQSV